MKDTKASGQESRSEDHLWQNVLGIVIDGNTFPISSVINLLNLEINRRDTRVRGKEGYVSMLCQTLFYNVATMFEGALKS